MPTYREYGSKIYITKSEKILFDKVKEKIDLKREIETKKGSTMLYTKSWILHEEIVEELTKQEPTNEILKWNPVYRQQIISKSYRIMGLKKVGKHTKPLWELPL